MEIKTLTHFVHDREKEEIGQILVPSSLFMWVHFILSCLYFSLYLMYYDLTFVMEWKSNSALKEYV